MPWFKYGIGPRLGDTRFRIPASARPTATAPGIAWSCRPAAGPGRVPFFEVDEVGSGHSGWANTPLGNRVAPDVPMHSISVARSAARLAV